MGRTLEGHVRKIDHPTVDERTARGKAARSAAKPSSHAGWTPADDRPDPVALLDEQNETREADLVPVRHGRMMVSPFTFYRGAARIMAEDLKDTPRAGLDVQLCGDAHLSNFGAYASPDRALVFDLNDFDETLPGPFEYDVKRLAASFTIAARNNGFSPSDAADATGVSVRSYRQAMIDFSQMRTLDIWYARLDEQELMAAVNAAARANKKGAKMAKTAQKTVDKARTRDSLQALSKLAEHVDGRYRIVSQPPVVVPLRDLSVKHGYSIEQLEAIVHDQFREYRESLPDDRRTLLERFEIVDMAQKIVGVGSVGIRAFILLLQGRDDEDPLFLQIKGANASVLEGHLPKSRYAQPGERVVQGQWMMQASSDIFLGWAKGGQPGHHSYWRQLRDMKGSAVVENMAPAALTLYAQICGETLARAHARSGDPVAIAAYLGPKAAFDTSITDFATRYADQNDADYEAFTSAIRSGRLPAVEGV